MGFDTFGHDPSLHDDMLTKTLIYCMVPLALPTYWLPDRIYGLFPSFVRMPIHSVTHLVSSAIKIYMGSTIRHLNYGVAYLMVCLLCIVHKGFLIYYRFFSTVNQTYEIIANSISGIRFS